MPHTGCCVPFCSNRGNGHRFPRNKKMSKLWTIAIRREKWKPSPNSLVCKEHFTPDDYRLTTNKGGDPLLKRLKKSAVPSLFSWTRRKSSVAIAREERVAKRSRLDDSCAAKFLEFNSNDVQPREEVVDNIIEEPSTFKTAFTELKKDVYVQTEAVPSTILCIEKLRHKDVAIKHYTGFENYKKFNYVLNTLGPAASELNYRNFTPQRISVENQFLLTIIKLRKHMSYNELSILFDISKYTVSNIFVTWINFMYHQWRELDIWPSKQLVAYFTPTDFKRKFPQTRVIIDGTEIPIKKPCNPNSQQETWSSYKNRNTLKTLVGCTPGGLISYIQEAHGGSASDRLLCERGTLTQKCEKGDSIMSDKGFNVQDIFAPHDIGINIPTFLRKKNQLSTKAVCRDRKIAQKRVLIERVIGLAKTYSILNSPLNDIETAMGTQILFVCFMLCNFRGSIVPHTR